MIEMKEIIIKSENNNYFKISDEYYWMVDIVKVRIEKVRTVITLVAVIQIR